MELVRVIGGAALVGMLLAEWRLAGRLGLPWKPSNRLWADDVHAGRPAAWRVRREGAASWDAFLAALVPRCTWGRRRRRFLNFLESRDAGKKSLHWERATALVPVARCDPTCVV